MVGFASEKQFIQCASCHSLEKGVHGLGPSLYKIKDKQAGKQTGFRYSSAMKRSSIRWTRSNLDKYIESPQSVVPGGRMPYSGESDEKVRKQIIDYIFSQ